MSALATAKPLRVFKHAPKAKFATPRDPSWLTEGDEIARLSRLMGRELMPWQKQVVDVATEYRIDSFGRRVYHYRKVLITVPRQSGKTTVMGPVKVHRIMTRPGVKCFSTAQTGKDARNRMMDLLNYVSMGPLSPIFKPLKSNGAEGLEVRKHHASVTRFSPVVGALHGETPFMVDFDEIWKYSKALGDNLLGAASPGMITLDGQAQIWFISTKGTAASEFMNELLEIGEKGTDPSMCFFEWSMPKGMDPDDPATWWEFHPALGNTITEDSLREEMYAPGVSRAERIRAYMNLLTEAEDPIIPKEKWEAMALDPEAVPRLGDVTISYEVAPDGACGTVLASWRDLDGMPVSRVLHRAPGTSWMPPYIRWVKAEWEPHLIAADGGGPARWVTDQLTKPAEESGHEPIDVRTLDMNEYGIACMAWLELARDEGQLKHDGSKPFASSIANAVTRTRNGVETFSRDHSTAPIPEVIASAVGLYAMDHIEAPLGLQLFG